MPILRTRTGQMTLCPRAGPCAGHVPSSGADPPGTPRPAGIFVGPAGRRWRLAALLPSCLSSHLLLTREWPGFPRACGAGRRSNWAGTSRPVVLGWSGQAWQGPALCPPSSLATTPDEVTSPPTSGFLGPERCSTDSESCWIYEPLKVELSSVRPQAATHIPGLSVGDSTQ